jgi:hypothetical protein
VGGEGRKQGGRDLFVVVFLCRFYGKRYFFLIHDLLKAVLVISGDFVFEDENLPFSDFSLF